MGMSVTWRWMWKLPVTVQYPQEATQPAVQHKGRIRFVTFPETGTHDCIACLICEKTCPSGCFSITGEKPAGGGKKRPTVFKYNLPTCSLCSLCIEACPTGTLEHSPEHNLASLTKQPYQFDFVADAKAQSISQPVKQKEEANAAVVG